MPRQLPYINVCFFLLEQGGMYAVAQELPHALPEHSMTYFMDGTGLILAEGVFGHRNMETKELPKAFIRNTP